MNKTHHCHAVCTKFDRFPSSGTYSCTIKHREFDDDDDDDDDNNNNNKDNNNNKGSVCI